MNCFIVSSNNYLDSEEVIIMSNINFKDYLNEQLKDPAFKKEFENEITKLESAIALTKVRKESGLSHC